MTKICIFAHFGLNIHHSFLYFVTLKGFVSALFRQNSKTNIMIKSWNRDISKEIRDIKFLPYHPPLIYILGVGID